MKIEEQLRTAGAETVRAMASLEAASNALVGFLPERERLKVEHDRLEILFDSFGLALRAISLEREEKEQCPSLEGAR